MNMLLSLMPTVALVVYGQIIAKWRITQIFSESSDSLDGMARLFVYLKDPYIISSYVAALAGSVAWVFVMERYAVSMAFPVYVGLTIVGVAVGGVLLFDESLTAGKIISIVLILIGVTIGSQS